MTINEILELKSLFEERQKQPDSQYQINARPIQNGRLYDFHQFANGKKCEGMYLVKNEYGQSYWFGLIEWNRKIGYYLIVFPENHSRPLIEIHKTEDKTGLKNFRWKYSPRKRDSLNKQREAYFSKFVSGGKDVVISFPKDFFEINAFFEDVFSLADIRLKSDNLDKDEPEARKGSIEGKRFEQEVVVKIEKENISNQIFASLLDEVSQEAEELDIRHLEGKVSKIFVNRYERDGRARRKCINHFGVSCQVCEFSFEEKFGEIGKGFIHVHHLKEISSIAKEYEVNPTEDLVPVCANCHAMLHRRKPAFSIEELKVIMKLN